MSYCATCDAFFYRGRDVAVLGSGEYALHEVQALLPVAHSVTLLTGGPADGTVPAGSGRADGSRGSHPRRRAGHRRAAERRRGTGSLRRVRGAGRGGQHRPGRKLGAEVSGSRIVVDDHMQTSLPGLYAAGDCTGGLLQVAKAVYEGAVAGTEAAKALRK